MKSHVFFFFFLFYSIDFLTHNRKDMTHNTHAGNKYKAYGRVAEPESEAFLDKAKQSYRTDT